MHSRKDRRADIADDCLSIVGVVSFATSHQESPPLCRRTVRRESLESTGPKPGDISSWWGFQWAGRNGPRGKAQQVSPGGALSNENIRERRGQLCAIGKAPAEIGKAPGRGEFIHRCGGSTKRCRMCPHLEALLPLPPLHGSDPFASNASSPPRALLALGPGSLQPRRPSVPIPSGNAGTRDKQCASSALSMTMARKFTTRHPPPAKLLSLAQAPRSGKEPGPHCQTKRSSSFAASRAAS